MLYFSFFLLGDYTIMVTDSNPQWFNVIGRSFITFKVQSCSDVYVYLSDSMVRLSLFLSYFFFLFYYIGIIVKLQFSCLKKKIFQATDDDTIELGLGIEDNTKVSISSSFSPGKEAVYENLLHCNDYR